MATWHTDDTVYLGDAFGNPRRVKIGVVTVGKRTTVGVQLNPDNPHDQPDYTMDAAALTELIRQLNAQRSALIEAGGWSS